MLFSAVIVVIAAYFAATRLVIIRMHVLTEEVPDGVARSVLKFGLPTLGLYFVCDLFRIRLRGKNVAVNITDTTLLLMLYIGSCKHSYCYLSRFYILRITCKGAEG
ncbi:hypothetical protein [Anaplasma phagocytophilum]|uniref:hypothetical protein n=1 Tax=Anaplasma phagocytophilum TaxID=948 RepID=UPI0005F9A520|nr:hypothetical protein [Anaplasma phagocytophilum]